MDYSILLFPIRVAGAHAYTRSIRGKSLAPAVSDIHDSGDVPNTDVPNTDVGKGWILATSLYWRNSVNSYVGEVVGMLLSPSAYNYLEDPGGRPQWQPCYYYYRLLQLNKLLG